MTSARVTPNRKMNGFLRVKTQYSTGSTIRKCAASATRTVSRNQDRDRSVRSGVSIWSVSRATSSSTAMEYSLERERLKIRHQFPRVYLVQDSGQWKILRVLNLKTDQIHEQEEQNIRDMDEMTPVPSWLLTS